MSFFLPHPSSPLCKIQADLQILLLGLSKLSDYCKLKAYNNNSYFFKKLSLEKKEILSELSIQNAKLIKTFFFKYVKGVNYRI